MSHDIDLVITLDDRSGGHTAYNLQAIEKLMAFLNHPAHVIVSDDHPASSTRDHLNAMKDRGTIHELLYLDLDWNLSMTKRQNQVYNRVFALIKTPWVVHFDGDVFCYRQGHDDWVERFINIIESGRAGAICHTAPAYRDGAILWVSTRFFITSADAVRAAINPALNNMDHHFESDIYYKGLAGKPSYLIPFNPTFLIIHILGASNWGPDHWNRYTQELRNGNRTLLDNIANSDWGDIHGDWSDCSVKDVWGWGSKAPVPHALGMLP